MRRLFVIVCLAFAATGCTYELRGNEVWACGDVTMADSQVVSGCQDTGVRVYQ